MSFAATIDRLIAKIILTKMKYDFTRRNGLVLITKDDRNQISSERCSFNLREQHALFKPDMRFQQLPKVFQDV